MGRLIAQMATQIFAFALLCSSTAFLQPPQRIARTALRAESLNRGSKPPMSDADKEAAMKRMGYVFDASRNTWTRPPPNRPARKPAIARSPASARLLEVRLGDGVSDERRRGAPRTVQGRPEAAGAVEAAAPTPRQTLEALGMSLAAAKVVGPVALALAQLGLWALCRDAAADFVVGDFFAGDVLPASLGDWRLAGLAAAFAVFGADPAASAAVQNALDIMLRHLKKFTVYSSVIVAGQASRALDNAPAGQDESEDAEDLLRRLSECEDASYVQIFGDCYDPDTTDLRAAPAPPMRAARPTLGVAGT
ncbi:hypothetical protein JL721_8912 [Aureococcus anophagefferens]|nr:hypothetical protein JL721_8912 [Aureococcus anophagefferens]